ncbi:MAG: hypothetical protein K1Y36_14900 [Blastocatellia bacterium]|nr:hypothetical protein [Blastocatellia bacterium]
MWQPAAPSTRTAAASTRLPARFRLDSEVCAKALRQAPLETVVSAWNSSAIIELPLPEGNLARFRVVESPILATAGSDLPGGMKTFVGQGVDDPTATTRFDWAADGLHALILSGSRMVSIHPDQATGDTDAYVTEKISVSAEQLQCLADMPEVQGNPAVQGRKLVKIEKQGLVSGGWLPGASTAEVKATVAPAQAVDDARFSAESIPADLLARMQELSTAAARFRSITFTATNGWLVIADTNTFAASNVPPSAFTAVDNLTKAGRTIRGVSFSPTNGWVILHDDRQFTAEGVPAELMTRLQQFSATGRTVKQVVFTSGTGWVLLADYNGFAAEGIPATLQNTLTDLAAGGEEIKRVALSPTGGWAVFFGSTGFRSEAIPASMLAKLTGFQAAERDFVTLAFPQTGNGWVAVATSAPAPIGGRLRTFRLAAAATGEYTQMQGGGTIDGAFASIARRVNFANAVYERELSTRFLLVDNRTAIFTNADADPYTNSNLLTAAGQNQPVLDERIGTANYDMGHLFAGLSSGVQGLAFSGICVADSKGRAASGYGVAPDSPLSTFILVHEMGHQQFANHSFNGTSGSCGGSNRRAEAAVEPGSGSTVMSYGPAGCSPEALGFTAQDIYFHSFSLKQMLVAALNATPGSCAQGGGVGNAAPQVNAGSDYVIPARTPFTLTATGSDPDGDALTYTWEETDVAFAPGPPNTDEDGQARPLFRSFPPASDPSRTFPNLANLLENRTVVGESLPTMNRTLRFQVTARDNRAGGGGVTTDSMQVRVVATGGPFSVTEPNDAVTWEAGSKRQISWNVAATNQVPVNCASVRIRLSTDGGLTFPTVLAESVPNSGSTMITVPEISTTTARLKIEAVGNIFFDLSDRNFTIRPQVADTEKPSVSNVTLSKSAVKRKKDPTLVITWKSSDNSAVTGHTLTYATDGANFSTSVAAGLPGSAQSFTWTIGSALAKTKTGVVKVRAEDAAGNAGEAVSGTFSIK